MNVGLSTLTRWVKQLRDERAGKTLKASPSFTAVAIDTGKTDLTSRTAREPYYVVRFRSCTASVMAQQVQEVLL